MKKERPVLFNGEMVRAILEGRKTQTRRPVKPQFSDMPSSSCSYIPENVPPPEGVRSCSCGFPKSPFGKAGDVLWVRETCLISPPNFVYQYNATHQNGVIVQYLATHPDREAASDYGVTKATPSIHMPKWACRIRLKVKRVWVERVQDIVGRDAVSEGVDYSAKDLNIACELTEKPFMTADELQRLKNTHPSNKFHKLWDQIYGKTFPAESNPWVWCCEFERCDND
jgi:hypothetical protein